MTGFVKTIIVQVFADLSSNKCLDRGRKPMLMRHKTTQIGQPADVPGGLIALAWEIRLGIIDKSRREATSTTDNTNRSK